MIDDIVKGVITQSTVKLIGSVSSSLIKKYNNYQLKNIDSAWSTIVEEVLSDTQIIDQKKGRIVLEKLPVVSQKNRLLRNFDSTIFKKFVLSLAMELCAYDKEKECAISLGLSIVDKWREKNKLGPIRYDYNVDHLYRIISDREQLYRQYFELFNDNNGSDIIKIFYPRNGEYWVRGDEKYSIDVRVKLSEGLPIGFCRPGFDYLEIISDNEGYRLQFAYIENGKETLCFDSITEFEDKLIIWLR